MKPRSVAAARGGVITHTAINPHFEVTGYLHTAIDGMIPLTNIDVDGSVITDPVAFWYITGNMSELYPFVFALSVDPNYGGIYQVDIPNDRTYRLTTEPTNSIYLAIDDAVEHIKVFWTVYCPDGEEPVAEKHNKVYWFEYDYADLPVMSSDRLIPGVLITHSYTITDMTAVAFQTSASRYSDKKCDIMPIIVDYRSKKTYVHVYTHVDWLNYATSFKAPVDFTDTSKFTSMELSGVPGDGAVLSAFNNATQFYGLSSIETRWFTVPLMVKDAIIRMVIEDHVLKGIKYVGALSVLPDDLTNDYEPCGAVHDAAGKNSSGIKDYRGFVFLYKHKTETGKHYLCHGVTDSPTGTIETLKNANIVKSWAYPLEYDSDIIPSPYSPRAGGNVTINGVNYLVVGKLLLKTKDGYTLVDAYDTFTEAIDTRELPVYSCWHTLVSNGDHADVYGTQGYHLRIYGPDDYKYKQYDGIENNRVTANGNFSHICRSDGVNRLQFTGTVFDDEITAPTLTRILNAISRIETKLDDVLYRTQKISYYPKV